MPNAKQVTRATKAASKKVVKGTKRGFERAKVLATKAGVALKRAKNSLKTSKKARAAVVAGAAVAAVAIGAALGRRSKR